VIDRLGEFTEVVDDYATPRPQAKTENADEEASTTLAEQPVVVEGAGVMALGLPEGRAHVIDLVDVAQNVKPHESLLRLDHVTLRTPDGATTLVKDLNLQVGMLRDTILLECLSLYKGGASGSSYV
jgi:hypothetical protein